MKFPKLILLALPLGVACNSPEPIALTEAQKKALVDSIVRERAKEIQEMEKERLRDLMSLELKVRTDSLLALMRPASVPSSQRSDTVSTDSVQKQSTAEAPADSSIHLNEAH